MNINDHSNLHDQAFRAVLAGGAFSVLPLLFTQVQGSPFEALFFAGFVASVLAAIVPPRLSSASELSLLLLVGIGAGAAIHLPSPINVGATAALIGLGLARGADLRLRERLIALLVGTSGALAALVIRRALLDTGVLVPWLGLGLSTLVTGGIAGGVIGLGAIGRLLGSSGRTVTPAVELECLADEIASASPEVAALLRRAAEAHRQAAAVVGRAPHAADDLVRRMVGFAREWLEIERRASATRPESLTERIALLESRLERTTDAVTTAELSRAADAVRAQRGALTEILAGRERAVARLEHQVATLERLRFAALRHRSADASRLASELQPLLDELAEAGGDYDVASDALRDADAETTAADPFTPRAN